jgi:uncharacterized alpha/beta hydrolase family protein
MKLVLRIICYFILSIVVIVVVCFLLGIRILNKHLESYDQAFPNEKNQNAQPQ